MYKVYESVIIINEYKKEFPFEIRSVIQYDDKYIVLLSIPFDKNDINNIYCINTRTELIWQSQDLNVLYPNMKNIPYEQMGMKDNSLFASDFYGRNYKIDVQNGKILDCNIVK